MQSTLYTFVELDVSLAFLRPRCEQRANGAACAILGEVLFSGPPCLLRCAAFGGTALGFRPDSMDYAMHGWRSDWLSAYGRSHVAPRVYPLSSGRLALA